MPILPSLTFAGCPPLDVIMAPGGPGQQDLMKDEEETPGFLPGGRPRGGRELGVAPAATR